LKLKGSTCGCGIVSLKTEFKTLSRRKNAYIGRFDFTIDEKKKSAEERKKAEEKTGLAH
jgi:hypothetical protein